MKVISTSISLSELLTILLSAAPELRIDALELDVSVPALTLMVTSTQTRASCPHCQQATTRIHSHYERTLADLPWAQFAIRLHLHVRKFFCDTISCPRRIFTERLPRVVAPWARRTVRLTEQQRHIGLAVGGSAGARLAAHLTRPASRNTLLHLLRTTPEKQRPTPRVLGIDDWSQRKGQTYRTILVDIERHQPIELLPDREAETLVHWLRQHPGVEIICRDRAGAYADGARRGAPSALQVADRFHLLRNLQETLMRVLEHHATALALLASPAGSQTAPAMSGLPDPSSAPDALSSRLVPPAVPSQQGQEQAHQRRSRRLARYEIVRQLSNQGWTVSAIAHQVGLNRDTVRKYVNAPAFPERQPRRQRVSVLDPYKPYILQRWNEGCHTGAIIWREIEQQGYRGKCNTVFTYISRLRQAHGMPPKKRVMSTIGIVRDRGTRPAAPRSLAWLVLRRPETLDEIDVERVVALRQLDPVLDVAVTLTQEFTQLVRERHAEALDGWLERATASNLVPFRNFVVSLRRDYAAVHAGLSLPWSSGPVEGQINRLKMIKRTMFGRAKLDLLRERVLSAA